MKIFSVLIALLLPYFATLSQVKEPARPRITGIEGVTLSSDDLQNTQQFFRHGLGLQECQEPTELLTELCFASGPNQTIRAQSSCPAEGACETNYIFSVTFETDDAAALRSFLKKSGVKVSELAGYQRPWKKFTAIDPEGHRIGFFQGQADANRQSAPNRVGTRMIHAGLVVHDRAAEDRFYKDVLGFHLYWQGGRTDDETSWVNMQVPDGTDWIEYMLNAPANADHHTLGGMNHIALGVPDIHTAEAQLRKNGWTGTDQPKIGRGGKWQLNLYDPDDTRIELMEFTPVQKPCCSEYTGPHPGPNR
jgi:catechol 2,3-dioxygenase-like lactoylglutathione lyase family enzyme